MTEITVVVVCRGPNSPADAARVTAIAVGLGGVTEVRIEKKET